MKTEIRFENGLENVEMFVNGRPVATGQDSVKAFWTAVGVDPASTPEWADDFLESALPDVEGMTDSEIAAEFQREFGED